MALTLPGFNIFVTCDKLPFFKSELLIDVGFRDSMGHADPLAARFWLFVVANVLGIS